MDFKPSEEQVLLRESVRRLVEKDYQPATRRKIAAEGEFSQELWRQFAEMGWLGLALPEQYGGGDIRDLAILLAALGSGLVMEPVLASAVVAPRLLIDSGDESRGQAFIPQVIAGEAKRCWPWLTANTRHAARGAPEYVETRAERVAGGWKLTGNKTLVLGGATADHYLVSARTRGDVAAAEGITLFLVDANTPGLQRILVPLTDDSHAADLSFEGMQLPDSAVLGCVDQAFPAIGEVLAWPGLAVIGTVYGSFQKIRQVDLNLLPTPQSP